MDPSLTRMHSRLLAVNRTATDSRRQRRDSVRLSYPPAEKRARSPIDFVDDYFSCRAGTPLALSLGEQANNEAEIKMSLQEIMELVILACIPLSVLAFVIDALKR